MLSMALPWMQDSVPITKSIPFDIDEMAEVLAAGESAHLPFNHALPSVDNKETIANHAVPLCSPHVSSVAQRSSDPGVVDLAFITQYKDEANLGCRSEGIISSFHFRKRHPGDIALNVFDVGHRLKNRLQYPPVTTFRRKQLSVRINATSSKATIVPSNLAGYLAAKLPAEVQDGRFLSMKRAKAIAKTLGTYDCRHGLPPTNPTGKNANRVTVGRTRRMWTSKSSPDKPQRVFFTSLLTGGKLDSGAQRRPRDIRLTIKVDGEYFFNHNSPQSSLPAETTSWATKGYTRPTKQFVVYPSKYICELFRHGNKKDKDVPTNQGKTDEGRGAKFQEHQLECLPDNTGIISVTCGSTGKINISSLHDTLNSAARRKSLYCTVCWATGSSELGEVHTCSVCGLLAHLQCCLDPGEQLHTSREGVISTEWTCAVCCAGRKQCPSDSFEFACRSVEHRRAARPPNWLTESHVFQEKLLEGKSNGEEIGKSASPYEQKCALCPYSGGAMSQIYIGDRRRWVHEVCRIWTDVTLVPRTEASPNGCSRSVVCALCGTEEAVSRNNSLVKCAASNCRVRFHPMCALLASKLQNHTAPPTKIDCEESEDRTDIQKKIFRDRAVTKDFTLKSMNYEGGVLVGNKHDSVPNRIPVCFCSFHHPSRDASLYGLYPGGNHLDQEVVLIPSLPRQS